MSFKRDGDDSSLLNCLQKRRVGDLLSSFIPTDEASLLKNGRYHCRVCHQGFVFDTLQTLAQHRKGKKHLENLSGFLERKRKSHPVQTATPKVSLMPSAPYDSRAVRKRNRNEPNRKICLNMELISKAEGVPQPETTAESSCQRTVKTYLRNISEKTSFEDHVREVRSRSNGVCPSRSTVPRQPTVAAAVQPAKSKETARDREERAKLNEKTAYYAKLRSDGWKKDARGNWARDEDAEFDTDEEPPQDYAES